ncbi:MAG: hypothetical protein J6B23_09345, partial [Clostridia bacterium]|nr:hypothetical protein [Clostridia bacterium]
LLILLYEHILATFISPTAVNFNDSPTHRKMVLASSEVLAYELPSTHLRPCGFASWGSSAIRICHLVTNKPP